LSLSVALVSGCATTPAAQAPAPGSRAVAPTGVAKDAARAAPTAADEGFKVPAGHTPKMLKGELRYCRSETIVGTRLPKQYCFTQEQLEEMEKRRRSIQEDLTRSRKSCNTMEFCSKT
jgi:hypothetical protein